MTNRLLRTLAAGTALVFLLSFAPVAVFADDGEDNSTTSTSSGQGSDDQNKPAEDESSDDANDDSGTLKERIQELKQQRQENKQQRLDANKLKACENRKTRITAIMNRSVTRAERQLELFTTISERVKAFYTKKGRTVANYDQLVAAVDAAKAKAQANLDTLKQMDSFECSAEDPKGDVEAFKLALKSINSDLKGYRTSVKNLIVAVKSAQSTAAKQEDGTGTEQEGSQQ